ncbi:MAG: response regulator [SAR324 cluster bacterium]|nr:response regulator [SAR324 cluster bacterium]
MNVLLVDDENDFLKVLIRLLNSSGHKVETAENGIMAWEKFSQSPERIDAIVTDINMPGLSGLELLEKIRKDNHEVSVIFMTGERELKYAIQALQFDAFDFLIKPFEAKQLIQVLKKLESIRIPADTLQETLQVYEEKMQITIPSKTKLVASVTAHLHTHFKSILEIYKINHYKYALCLQEALLNGIIHGNLGISSDIKETSWQQFNTLVKEKETVQEFADKKISISFSLNQKALECIIEDEGGGFDHNKLPNPNDPNSLLCSGRGILIIQQFMDDVTWNQAGNAIKMVKNRIF